MPQTVRYGEHGSQFAEAWPPQGSVEGVVVLVHGGWWRARHDLHLMDALCADVAVRGWLAWNLEFRRIEGGGGGWPGTLHDVLDGIAALDRSPVPVRGAPVAAVGHSAGGHLALLAAAEGRVPAAVGLAPVTDVRRCAEEGLGAGAAVEFAGADPERQRAASPRHRLPIGSPQLLVHGDADDRVPIGHSRDYAAAAGNVELIDVPGGDHFFVLDPARQAWQRAFAWIREHAGGINSSRSPKLR